jgi:hypothetical protein
VVGWIIPELLPLCLVRLPHTYVHTCSELYSSACPSPKR